MVRRPALTTLLVLILAAFAANLLVASESSLERNAVFVLGEDGYKAYRIPSLITTGKGTVLAFCEGRKNGRGDSGNIDLLVKRSADGGKTWSKPLVVWDDGENTCGNPCPVVDESTGHIHMLMTWNRGDDQGKALHAGTGNGTRHVYYCRSEDNGLTWSKSVEITDQTKDKSWWWYATGPGVGIQLKKGQHRGRLVIPCNHTAKGYYYGAHVIYSDDNAKTWHRSNTIKPSCNESQVVELSDGRLMMNMRSQEHTEAGRSRNGYRSIAFSEDGGATWSEPEFDKHLGDPVCQASIIRYDDERLLFSHPDPKVSAKRGKRIRMTIRMSSDDGGKTWPLKRLIHEDAFAYSSLTTGRSGTPSEGWIYLHFESGGSKMARFNLGWLLAGKATGDGTVPRELNQ